MSVQVSVLNKKQLKAADTLVEWLGMMEKVGKPGRDKVFQRLRMLHIVTEFEEEVLRILIGRTTK